MIQQVSRAVSGEVREEGVCRHHWIIEAPMGPVSNGACQLCNEVREFKNYIETAPWGEDTPAVQSIGQIPGLSSSEDGEDSEEN